MMRAELAVFTALLLTGLTVGSSFALQSPSNVNITCDNYGVVVSWTSSDQNATFILQLKQNVGSPPNPITLTGHQCNISKYLQNTGYNLYYVEVRARDGETESQAAESKTFSFSTSITADIHCSLEFPPVELKLGDGKLTVSFSNPLHLYRHAPALRNLSLSDSLLPYWITTEKNKSVNDTCTPESSTCKYEVEFPDKQEEYCVTLDGYIRQTYFQTTKQCFRPGTPIIFYFLPLLFVAACLVALASLYLAKVISKKIKKKCLSKFPASLYEPCSDDPFKPLRLETEPVERNPQVWSDITVPVSFDLSYDSGLVENSPCSSTCSTDEDDCGKESGGGELEPPQEFRDPYSKEQDMSNGGMSDGYDRPHGFVEMSPTEPRDL